MTQTVDLTQLMGQIETLLAEFEQAMASVVDLVQLEEVRVQFIGRKSPFNQIRKEVANLAPEDKPKLGQLVNAATEKMTAALETKQTQLQTQALNQQLSKETIDVSMPGAVLPLGNPHPLTLVIDEIVDIFHGLGYQCLDDDECPEVETEYYNFDALNFAADHPAKDMQDTYYCNVGPQVLLRSQTSNSQIRYMEKHQPPMRIICPGRVYRNEAVSSRKSVLFHQIEGLCIDKTVTLSDLKGTLHEFTKLFFGSEKNIRMRGSYFPFTEPSVEVDVQCVLCNGKGCRTCSHTGWLEVLGAGMVHPNVLQACGVDTNTYQGFAFGMGVERLAMLKFAISDIRSFYQNDLRFLSQFKSGI